MLSTRVSSLPYPHLLNESVNTPFYFAALSMTREIEDAPLWGRLLASPTKIRLGRKGLQRTSTLAYNENS